MFCMTYLVESSFKLQAYRDHLSWSLQQKDFLTSVFFWLFFTYNASDCLRYCTYALYYNNYLLQVY